MSIVTDNTEKDNNENENEEDDEISRLDIRRPSIFVVDFRYRIN